MIHRFSSVLSKVHLHFLQAAASQIQSMQRGRKERQEADFKRVYQTWNTLELEEEGHFLSQSAASSRVESLLRAYGPASSQPQNGSSAVSMAAAAGVSIEPSDWGSGIAVEKDYRGPHVTWPLTKATVEAVLLHIRTEPDVPLHPKYVAEILGRACLRFREISAVHDMQVQAPDLGLLPSPPARFPPLTVPRALPMGGGAAGGGQVPPEEGGRLVICGDTHGQLADFLWILKQNGEPGPGIAYLMNGDIADRGDYACEIFIITLLYMLLYPDKAGRPPLGGAKGTRYDSRRSRAGEHQPGQPREPRDEPPAGGLRRRLLRRGDVARVWVGLGGAWGGWRRRLVLRGARRACLEPGDALSRGGAGACALVWLRRCP